MIIFSHNNAVSDLCDVLIPEHLATFGYTYVKSSWSDWTGKTDNLWNRSPLIIETRVTEYNHTAWRRHYYLKWDIKTLTSLTCVHFEYISKKHFFIDLTDYVLWSHLTHIISVIFVNLITHLTNIYGYLSVLVILEWQCKKNAINQFMNDW